MTILHSPNQTLQLLTFILVMRGVNLAMQGVVGWTVDVDFWLKQGVRVQIETCNFVLLSRLFVVLIYPVCELLYLTVTDQVSLCTPFTYVRIIGVADNPCNMLLIHMACSFPLGLLIIPRVSNNPYLFIMLCYMNILGMTH